MASISVHTSVKSITSQWQTTNKPDTWAEYNVEDNTMALTSTVEYIHHYTCSECKGWWTIATHEKYKPKAMYCTHCGHRHTVINVHDVRTGDLVKDD